MNEVSIIFTPAGLAAGTPKTVTFQGGAHVAFEGGFVRVTVEGAVYHYNATHVGSIKQQVVGKG